MGVFFLSLLSILIGVPLAFRAERRKRFPAEAMIVFAVVPRLLFWFADNGHGDAENSVEMARNWLLTGVYRQRWPGVPVYDFILGMLDRAALAAGIPYFYLSNGFSVLCVVATLACLFALFRPILGFRPAFAAAVVFNFYPQELVIGAATYELNLLMALLSAAWLLIARGRREAALWISLIAVGAKLTAVSLVIPLALLLLRDDWRAKDWGRFARHFFLPPVVLALIFLPRFLGGTASEFFAPFFGAPIYHADISSFTRHGAFLLRTGNLLGPFGVPLLMGALACGCKRLRQVPFDWLFLVAGYSIILIYFMFAAPWEAYYLLPIVPLAFFLAFWLTLPVWLVVAFCASALLPNFVQIQVKPWKWLPFEIHDGVVKAHVERHWGIRGGG